MKKLLKITALSLALLMMVLTLASCGAPNKDPAKAKAALEGNGYVVTLKDGKLVEIVASALGIDDLDAQIVAVSKEDIDDYITIYYFETKDAANAAWEKIEEEADEKMKDEEDVVLKKSGTMIYYGSKNAVKAAK